MTDLVNPEQEVDDLEERAVDEAKATADAAMIPRLLLNAPSAEVLLKQVDGPSLNGYSAKEASYVGKSLPIPAGGDLEVPIQVDVAGSMVEYEVDLKNLDIMFGITAEREEGVTVVKDASKLNVAEAPLKQKFLVGSVPCILIFRWDNTFSWMREKVISYQVKVTPPSRDSVIAGRRRRATACLKAVKDDLLEADERLTKATDERKEKSNTVENLEKQLDKAKEELRVAQEEEKWLIDRKTLRKDQETLLRKRLEKGWSDEK